MPGCRAARYADRPGEAMRQHRYRMRARPRRDVQYAGSAAPPLSTASAGVVAGHRRAPGAARQAKLAALTLLRASTPARRPASQGIADGDAPASGGAEVEAPGLGGQRPLRGPGD